MQKWIPWLYLGLGLSQAGHSIEEVLTGLWRWMPVVSGTIHHLVTWLPIVRMPEMTFIIANMLLITLMLGFSPILFLNRTWAWTIATVVAAVETVNAAGHLSMALALHGYFSGSLAAIFLLFFSVPIWGRRIFFKKGLT
jgi:hypothetical protein